MTDIRVRIAPSPTGYLHVGTARAALFNYLFAKKYGGIFILRIEDTDLERSDRKYEKDVFEGLRWLGIEPDEGPEQGGPYGPYRQSERTETYKKYLEALLRDGKAFYCFHSERELEEEKEGLLAAKRPPLHMCEYRTMDPAEAQILTETKPDYIIRFKTPAGRKITFHDLVRGEVSFSSDLIGDFSIAKKVDIPLYHFAVVVDDEEMRISHVIRGEDHIANTSKHILLIEALGFAMPLYAHLPLLLGTDRSKLSKRHGATSIAEYREAGYLPETILNFLALLGWNPGGDREMFTSKELIREFSLEKVQKSGAVFDVKKLDWMNGEYIRRKSPAELTDLCLPFLIACFGADTSEKDRAYLERVIALEQPRLKKLAEIGERTEFFFKRPVYDASELLYEWRNMSPQEAIQSLQRVEKTIMQYRHFESMEGGLQEICNKLFAEALKDQNKGQLLWPLRVALTGKKASPGPFEIMEILGVKESLKRIQAAKEKLV